MKISNNYIKSSLTRYIFTLLLSVTILSSANAQKEEGIDLNISANKMKDRAAYAMKTGDPYTALFYYEEAVKKDTQDIEGLYQLAEAYRITRNYSKAEETYGIVYKKAAMKYPFSLYNMGVMQKMNGKYEEAKKNLILFRKEARNLGDKNFKRLLNKEISGCDSGIVYKEFPDNVEIQNIGDNVNQPHAEFSPFLLDSATLLFGSLRMEPLKYFDQSSQSEEVQPVRKIYKAEKVNGKWLDKGEYELMNDPEFQMGKFVYSSISNKYYFSKCSKNKFGHAECKIYSTEKVNGKWSEPELLPFPVNMDGFTSTQPTIMIDTASVAATTDATPKTKTKTPTKKPVPKAKNKAPVKTIASSNKTEYLYFVSDRPGGKGGLDIWYTYFNSRTKQWNEPKNFSLINTPETECTPFFHVGTQTFYFSSDGHTTAGGLDVFKTSKIEGGRYSAPQNLAFPINSPQDDLDFMIGNDSTKGFLVSNRPGGTPYFHETCCDDIYAFDIKPAKPFICTLDLSIIEPDSSNCKDQLLKIRKYELRTKQETTETIRLMDCKYQVSLEKNHQYTFQIDRKGYQKDSLVVSTRDMASTELLQKQLVLKLEEKEKEVEFIAEVPVEEKPFVLKDIQYETNQTELGEEAKHALDSLLIPFLNLHPKDKVIISSHTDSQGSKKYNQHLSQQRAENVVKYLISKGIHAHRLSGKGYGESQPIAPNENPDGSDNPIGRSINRRTEFLLHKPAN